MEETRWPMEAVSHMIPKYKIMKFRLTGSLSTGLEEDKGTFRETLRDIYAYTDIYAFTPAEIQRNKKQEASHVGCKTFGQIKNGFDLRSLTNYELLFRIIKYSGVRGTLNSSDAIKKTA